MGGLSTLLGVVGKLISLAEAPVWVQVVLLLLAFLLIGLGMVALVWVTAYDQCTEEPYVAGDSGPDKMKGSERCIAGAVWQVQSDFSGPSLSWLAPWTASHDRMDVVVSSKFWDVVELNTADVFCTDDDEPTRNSEYMRCYFYTERVCKAATGSAIGATVVFLALIIPVAMVVIPAVISAAITCVAGVSALVSGGFTWVSGPLLAFCAAFIAVTVLALLLFALAIYVGALVGGWIGLAASSVTPPTAEAGSHPAMDDIRIIVSDLVSVKGNLMMREESDEVFHSQRVNIFWWVSSVSRIGVADDIPSSPFSYCDINDRFYREETDDAGNVAVKSYDGCGTPEMSNAVPSRCR